MAILIPAWVNGILTPVEKLEAHRKGLRHKAVSVFVMAGRKVLIQQRAQTKYHTPGLWANTCCTHPDWEEAAEDCAIRRLKEELGIIGLTVTFRDHLEYRADVGNGLIEHEVVDVFVARTTTQLALDLNPVEVMDTRWIDINDLVVDLKARPDQYTPWLHIYLDQHRDAIFGTHRSN